MIDMGVKSDLSPDHHNCHIPPVIAAARLTHEYLTRGGYSAQYLARGGYSAVVARQVGRGISTQSQVHNIYQINTSAFKKNLSQHPMF